MTRKISATAVGAVLAAALFTTACEEKKDEPAKAPEKTEAKSDTAAEKKEGTVAASEDKAKEGDAEKKEGEADKEGKEGSCGEGSCG